MKKTYRRILNNEMTVVGYKLFKYDRSIHYGFLLYRLVVDFGFTLSEVANFTGIPPTTVRRYIGTIKKLLLSEVLKILTTSDMEKEIEQFDMFKLGQLPHGYMDVKKWEEFQEEVPDEKDRSWFSYHLVHKRKLKWSKRQYVFGNDSAAFFTKLLYRLIENDEFVRTVGKEIADKIRSQHQALTRQKETSKPSQSQADKV